MTKELLQYIKKEKGRYIKELISFLRIPSVSADPARKKDIARCADWLKKELKTMGLEQVKVFKGKGNPIVYGEWLSSPKQPTVLIYGHYDVQPADPLEEWDTPPFQPSIRKGKIYARGASDNKGNIFIHLKAVEAHLKVNKTLPVNVKFIIEGEEEMGSKFAQSFVKTHPKLLKAEVVLNADFGGVKKGIPEVEYGLRGICCFELTLTGSAQDLHSGIFGGVVANPLFVLCHLLSKLKDNKTGKILIPGFYKNVQPITRKERQELARIPFNEIKEYKERTGAPELFGEKGYSYRELAGFRPTLEINGIWGGYAGEGFKTVIPAKAQAKVSMRLVPNQDPQRICKLFEGYIKKICPPTVKLGIKRVWGIAKPWKTPINSPFLQKASQTLEKLFGKKPIFDRSGATIALTPVLSETLKAPIISMCFNSEDSNMHAPNENLNLSNFYKGIQAVSQFLEEIAKK